MEPLQDFMLLFRLEPTDRQPTPQELAAMQSQWGAFIGGIAAQARLVSTSRLAFEGRLIDKTLTAKDGISITDNQALSGNMVLKAATLDEACEMAKGCPVLHVGGSVEVRNIVPMQP